MIILSEQKRYPIESSNESIEGEIEWLLTKDQIKLWSTFCRPWHRQSLARKEENADPVTFRRNKAMKKRFVLF